jgi:hypothetical protein
MERFTSTSPNASLLGLAAVLVGITNAFGAIAPPTKESELAAGSASHRNRGKTWGQN